MNQHFDEKADTWDDDPTRTARAADVARRIREEVPLGASSHVLDFGSGTGLLGFQLISDVASVTFADPSQGMLEQVGRKLRDGGHANGHVLRFDPRTPDLPGSYDVIVSLLALHHADDPAATLRLLASRLEPGGWLAVCDLDTEDGTFHDPPHPDVHLGFDRDALVERLGELGLEDARAVTAYVVRKERPEGVGEYPLFLLMGRRPRRAPPEGEGASAPTGLRA